MKIPPHNMPVFNKRVVLFAGGYGSGKTEVAVNYALRLSRTGSGGISIIDLDIVNPYFRTREAADELETHGIRVIIPNNEHCFADLPIILPDIRGAVERTEERVIIDVGGDDVGSRVLSSMIDAFEARGYEFLMVLNANRPFTSSVEGCMKMMRGIETSSRMKFSGIISNSHLIEETTPETILDGYRLAQEVSGKMGVPVVFVSALSDVLEKMDEALLPLPILPLSRLMLKPWEMKKAVRGL
jgi:hypothetical protein